MCIIHSFSTFKFILIVPPSQPCMPEVSNVTGKGCTITWKHPEHDGGNDIQGYILERREKKSSRWIKCTKELILGLR